MTSNYFVAENGVTRRSRRFSAFIGCLCDNRLGNNGNIHIVHEIEVTEEWVEQREEMNDGLDAFIALTQKYVDVEELTQTIVNEYIKKIVVFAPDKSSGKRKQKVKIFFNFVDDVDIPIISEPIITQTTYERRKTA